MSGPRYSIIPGAAATDPDLKPRDLQVLVIMGIHINKGGWCRRSQVTLAGQAKCSRGTIQNSLARLIDAGYVEKHEQRSESGRTSAHFYRVILDPKIDDFDSVHDAETADPARETSSEILGQPVGRGANQLAGGANSMELAGGANSMELAPMLTPDSNDLSNDTRERGERRLRRHVEPVKQGGDDMGAGSDDTIERYDDDDAATGDPEIKRIRGEQQANKLFHRLVDGWPQWEGTGRERARKMFADLPVSDQDAALQYRDAWFALLRENGKKYTPAPTTYLTDEPWKHIPQSAPPVEKKTEYAKPYGKKWGAARFAELIKPPTRGPGSAFTRTEQKMIEAGTVSEADVIKRKTATNGWPRVNSMHETAARSGKGWTVEDRLDPLADLFVAVKVDGPLWLAWRHLHEDRGWPWFAAERLPHYVYFPSLPGRDFDGYADAVSAAMKHFEDVAHQILGEET